MANWQTVLVKITAMFLVILVGWAVRRRGYLAAETTRVLSRFVVDVAFPSLSRRSSSDGARMLQVTFCDTTDDAEAAEARA